MEDLALKNSFVFDLQLFAGEKTEDATPKRREEARKKGQIAKSQDLNLAVTILASFIALNIVAPDMYQKIFVFMQNTFLGIASTELTVQNVYYIFISIAILILRMIAPVMLTVLTAGLVINYFQVGFMFNTEALAPKFDKLNPLPGLKRMFFEKRTYIELVKAALKLLIIGYVTYSTLKSGYGQLIQLINSNLLSAVGLMGSYIIKVAIRAGIILLILGIFDYAYQWWEFEQSIKMSKQEVKDEAKQTEGDPQIKGKIKQRQREAAQRRMMQSVPKADVVITNPTHFAIALKYDEKISTAPIVVAKGADFVAEQIKKIAKENRVPIVENKFVAQTLYKSAEIGDEIPGDLYQAVAEILAFVFKMKRRA